MYCKGRRKNSVFFLVARQAHKAAGRRTGDAMLAVIPVPDPRPHIAQDPDPPHYTQNS